MTAASLGEILRVVGRLHLQNAIYRNDELNEIVDRLIALFRGYLSIASDPLELVQNGVLGFLFPVVEKYVLEQGRKILVRLNALPVMHLCK